MRIVLIVLSVIALIMLLASPIAVYLGSIELETSKKWMFAATILWFATTPFWMKGSGASE